MQCPRCGSENVGTSKFCVVCGEPLIPQAEERQSTAPLPSPIASVPEQSGGERGAGAPASVVRPIPIAGDAPSQGSRQGRVPAERSGSTVNSALVALIIVAFALVAVAGFALGGSLFDGRAQDGDSEASSQEDVTSQDVQTVEGTETEAYSQPRGHETSATAMSSADMDNVLNGGYVCEGSGWVFVAKPESRSGWWTPTIMRMRVDGSESQTIYTSSVSGDVNIWHMCYYDGRIYFQEQPGGAGSAPIYSINTSGTDRRQVATCDAGTLLEIDQGYLYYEADNRVRRIDLDSGGGSEEVLNVGGDARWRVMDGIVWNFTPGSHEVYWSTVGAGQLAVASMPAGYSVSNVLPNGDGAYYLLETDSGSDKTVIYYADLGGEFEPVFSNGDVIRMNPYDSEVILFSESLSGGSVLNWQWSNAVTEGTGDYYIVQLYSASSRDGEIRYIHRIDDTVFFGIDGDTCTIHAVNTDGCDHWVI